MNNSSKSQISREPHVEIIEIIRAYRPLIQKSTGNSADAQDLEQDIYLSLLENLTTNPVNWERVKNPRAYITAVIRHRAYDLLKSKQKAKSISYDDVENSFLIEQYSDLGGYERKLQEDMDLGKIRSELADLINTYSEEEQELIQLSFIEGLKPKQIAVMLGKDPAHVSIDCNRIRAKLRGQLKKSIRQMHTGNYICSNCGTSVTKLPFEPRDSQRVLCRNCHIAKRPNRT